MSSRIGMRALIRVAAFACAVGIAPAAFAFQNNNNNNGGFFGFGEIGTVGGVKISADHVVESAPAKLDAAELKRLREATSQSVDAGLQTTTELRKVSLRGLYQAVEEAMKTKKPLPPEVAFMAGLQRIEYVFLCPDQMDIILAGPAEGWKVDDAGNVVGITTGCPVMRLEDFIVALRSVENARGNDVGISCSINPSAEGAAALSKLLKQLNAENFNADAAKAIEASCGPQVITLTGMPTNSRFAQVLVAADYKMKRLSMGFENAPIEGLPSYLELAKHKDSTRTQSSPRFWMECNYRPLGRSEDGMTWQLRGTGVKTLVEDGRLNDAGVRVATGGGNALAEKWAETMTERFDALAQKEPAFRELRNLMDMSVVAALIAKENMLERASLEIPLFSDETKLDLPEHHSPKSVPTQCSFVRLTSSFLVTASGGVQVDPWSVVEQSEVVAQLADSRATAVRSPASQWWWN